MNELLKEHKGTNKTGRWKRKKINREENEYNPGTEKMKRENERSAMNRLSGIFVVLEEEGG